MTGLTTTFPAVWIWASLPANLDRRDPAERRFLPNLSVPALAKKKRCHDNLHLGSGEQLPKKPPVFVEHSWNYSPIKVGDNPLIRLSTGSQRRLKSSLRGTKVTKTLRLHAAGVPVQHKKSSIWLAEFPFCNIWIKERWTMDNGFDLNIGQWIYCTFQIFGPPKFIQGFLAPRRC